jgi:hypothetical protein
LAAGNRALNAGNEQRIERDKRVFEADSDETTTAREGDALGVTNVVRVAVGDEDAKWFEGSGGEEALDFLSGHAADYMGAIGTT